MLMRNLSEAAGGDIDKISITHSHIDDIRQTNCKTACNQSGKIN